MYPVNDYLIVKEVGDSGETTVSMPKSTMLQLPPQKIGIKKYEVVKSSIAWGEVGTIIAVDVRDVRQFFDGTYIVKWLDIIATNQEEK